ncbi:hypothetical protein C2845_PM17G05090 [Panicum miliaceum]|uniref:DUF8039 domain-containing protein n=1 Tax=Panicum miliaceum TaxID=4540 RepID=A0A3L6Q267_PANMI|nr:hypothetical protein C2845_PM17G05090 [Panicum miliaceum]
MGSKVPWGKGFSDYSDSYRSRSRSKSHKAELTEERIIAMVDERVQQVLSQSSQFNINRASNPPAKKSSCASTGQLELDAGPFPVDEIQEATRCRLHAPIMGISIQVAAGQVFPSEPGMMFHNVLIPKGFTTVQVDMVLNSEFEKFKLEIPVEEEEISTLGDAVGNFILWRKRCVDLVHPSRPSSAIQSAPRQQTSPEKSKSKEQVAASDSSPKKSKSKEKDKPAKNSITSPEKLAQAAASDSSPKKSKSKEKDKPVENSITSPEKLVEAAASDSSPKKSKSKEKDKSTHKDYSLFPVPEQYERGLPLCTQAHLLKMSLQCRALHDWYMKATNEQGYCNLMGKFAYKHFLHRSGRLWVDFDDLRNLYHLLRMDSNLMRCWTLQVSTISKYVYSLATYFC